LVKCRVGYPFSSTASEALMSTLDLRPLSIGELLDRTFSLYRRNFLLFIGIAALPQLLVLALQLVQVILTPAKMGVARPATEEFQAASPVFTTVGVAGIIVLALVGIIVYFIAYLFSQGATVYAVSDSISEDRRRSASLCPVSAAS